MSHEAAHSYGGKTQKVLIQSLKTFKTTVFPISYTQSQQYDSMLLIKPAAVKIFFFCTCMEQLLGRKRHIIYHTKLQLVPPG